MSKLQFRVHNGMDIIDSRDIVARVQELESELEYTHHQELEAQDAWLAEVGPEAVIGPRIPADFDAWLKVQADSDIDDAMELLMLRSLVEEINANAGDNAEDGVALIADSYFEEYAEEFAQDIGAIQRGANWPLDCIDWARAARELQYDYSQVDFDGVTYWVHS